MSWERYREWIQEIEATEEYQRAGLEIEFTEELCRVMEEQGISRAELARRAGTSPAYITKILRGSTNFTLATMAKLARALEMEVRLHLAPSGSRTIWKDNIPAVDSWPEWLGTIEQGVDRKAPPGSQPGAIPEATGQAGARSWRAVSSASMEFKGEEKHESPADQVA